MKRPCLLEIVITVAFIVSVSWIPRTSFVVRDPEAHQGIVKSYAEKGDWGSLSVDLDDRSASQLSVPVNASTTFLRQRLQIEGSNYLENTPSILDFKYHQNDIWLILDSATPPPCQCGYWKVFGKVFMSYHLLCLLCLVRLERTNRVVNVGKFIKMFFRAPFCPLKMTLGLSSIVIAPKLPELSAYAALNQRLTKIEKHHDIRRS